MSKTLAYYRRLPYARRCQLFVEGPERFWHAWIEELPGCEVDSDSKAAAYVALDEVFEDYINTKLEWRSTIPEPTRWPSLAHDRSARLDTDVDVVMKPLPPRSDITNVEPTERTGTLVLA